MSKKDRAAAGMMLAAMMAVADQEGIKVPRSLVSVSKSPANPKKKAKRKAERRARRRNRL